MSKFEEYMCLYVSKGHAKRLNQYIKSMFESGAISTESFSSAQRLYEDLMVFCSRYSSTSTITPGNKTLRPNQDTVLNLYTKSITVAKYLNAVIYYNKFCGNKKGKKTTQLLNRQISTRARNQEESDLLIQFFQYNVTINIFNTITAALWVDFEATIQHCQSVAMKVPVNSAKEILLPAGQVDWKAFVKKFGSLMELVLRLYVIPIPVQDLQKLKLSVDQKNIKEVEVDYKRSKQSVYLFLNTNDQMQIQLCISVAVPNDKNKDKRLVHILLPNWFGGIFLVYICYFRVNKTVFPKKNITANVKEYIRSWQIPGQWLGLEPAHGYHHQTKIMWMLRQTYTNLNKSKIGLLDPAVPNIIAEGGSVTGLAFVTSQSNRYYHGLRQYRKLVAAIEFFKDDLAFGSSTPALDMPCLSTNTSAINLGKWVFGNVNRLIV